MRRFYQRFKKALKTVLKAVTFTGNGTFKAARLENFVESSLVILLRPLRNAFSGVNWRKTSEFVEKKYDQLSGSYIDARYYDGRDVKDLYYIDNQVEAVSYIRKHRKLTQECGHILSRFTFGSILEVGAGELTTLSSLAAFFDDMVDCYAMDLSLNRVVQGWREFKKRYRREVTVCKANAVALPYADNCFDMVFTSHCLEHMPYDYKAAIVELCRVSRKLVVLFEPSYELGTFSQKIRMIAQDYVRGMPEFIRSLDNVELVDHFLLGSGDLFNRTACHLLYVKKSEEELKIAEAFHYVCPICKTGLQVRQNYLRCNHCRTVYFTFENIPLLDEKYAVYITDSYSQHAG